MRSKLSRFVQRFYAVPWCVPAWGWNELSATVRTIATAGAVRGPFGERFAAAVRDYLGMTYAIPLNRGRTAIEVGLRAMGIGAGDEVVLPSFVCRSVLEALLGAGATPVFADMDATLNMTAASVEAVLSERTRCVIVAHIFGNAAPVDEIETLLAPRGIALMDDAAQALGVRRRGKLVGSFGNCGIVCCGPGKPLAGAAGGVLVTNDKRLFDRAHAVRIGWERDRDVRRRTFEFWVWRRLRGYTLPFKVALDRLRRTHREAPHVNARMSNLDGAIGLEQIMEMEHYAAERRRNTALLVERLAGLPGTVVTDRSPASMAVKLIYILPETGPSVDEVVEVLAANGIEAQGGYAPLHREYGDDSRLPVTAALWTRVLSVPVETRPPRAGRIVFPTSSPTPPVVPTAQRDQHSVNV